MDIEYLNTHRITQDLISRFLGSAKTYGHVNAEAYMTVFECHLASVELWIKSEGSKTVMWVKVEEDRSEKLELPNNLDTSIEFAVRELLSYVRISNIELSNEYISDEGLCPMCGTELYEDEQYCPRCRELVR